MPQTNVTKTQRTQRQMAARQWLLSAQWKLLVMRGVRVLPQAEGEEQAPTPARTTVRIFANGCPAHCMREVLEILCSETTLVDPKVDGVALSGTWTHRFAAWNRDSGTAEGDGTKTLIRDLGDGTSSFDVSVEDGCGSRTTVRYEWDRTEVEDISAVAHAGEQGYSVRIGGVSRDPETNLFFYYVTVTERKTQVLGMHEVSEDAFTKEYEAQWSGLRGTVDAPTDDSGGAVTVWDPAVIAAGELTSVQWSRNLEDCTLNAQGRKRIAKFDVTASESCSRDLFGERDEETVSAAEFKLGHAPAPSGGVSYDHQSRLRQDGRFDNSVTERREFRVDEARVSRAADVFSLEESVTSRGQTAEPAAPAAGDGAVETVTVEKTPGNLKNITISRKTELAVPDAQVSLERTVFASKRRAVAKSSAGAVPEPSAGGGIGVSVTQSLTPGGRKDVTVDTDEELFVGAAQVSEVETAFESVYRYTDVHTTAERPPATFADGVSVETSEDRQPLGSKNISVTVRTEKDVPQASRQTAKTAFEEQETVEEVSAGAASDAPAPSGGLVVSVSDQLTPAGKHRKRVTETQEVHVPEAEVVTVKTPIAVRTVVSARGAPAPAALGPDEYGTTRNSLTPGRLFNTTKETSADSLGVVGFYGYDNDYLESRTATKDVVPTQTPANSKLVGRVLTTESFDRTDAGGFIRTRVVREIPEPRSFTLVDKKSFFTWPTSVLLLGRVQRHTLSKLYLNTDIASVNADIAAFLDQYTPFEVSTVRTTIFFSYHPDVDFGLRVNEFGKWSGGVTMSVVLTNAELTTTV